MKIEIPEFEKEDYMTSTAPYEWLYRRRGNRFEHKQLCGRMADAAVQVGVRNFVSLYKEYTLSIQGDSGGAENQTDFSDQELGLWCGDWTADDGGIYSADRNGFEICACPHPIMPVRRLVNIDTGLEKLELAYQRGGVWKKHIFDKSTISDARSIIKLSDFGVSVNSDTAKYLVKYLGELESLNYERLPSANSVGRLGWIDGFGFSPYVENLVFDGRDEFRDRFGCVHTRGSFEAWLDLCRAIRGCEGVPTRIVLAAAFASVLVKPCGCLPFLLHLWGGSEVGKTVGLMLAASVWADPELGRYIQSFNGTSVGKELGAAFYNSLPLLLDELQIIDGSTANRLKFQQMIYELAEGIGRTRGRKSGGLQKTGSWRNCIISTGENPLIDANTAAGAANRTIEIHCQDVKLFANSPYGGGKEIARILSRNFGYAGKLFVERLQEPGNMERAIDLHSMYTEKILSNGDVTDKQAASAALLLAADALADEFIFQDGIRLSAEELIPYLITKTRMDQNLRALEFLYDQIAINAVHFDPERALDRSVELWGKADADYIYIIKAKFDRLLNENGYNAGAFLGWARKNWVIRPGKDGKNTVTCRIGGKPARCVWLSTASMPAEAGEETDEKPLPM